ncbi:hypothetical protein F5Y14DRAFT_458179 [Nemania sp. NC0429]|nr:hypothetical protein F5Y14DRAFT_458179 [Nemania sp. NC0429]
MSSETVSNDQQACPLAKEVADYTGSKDLIAATHASDYNVEASLSSHLGRIAIANPSPRSLMDLPDELLLQILRPFRNVTGTWHHRYDYFEEDIITIKNVRLTCRRLGAVGSHFLTDFVSVEPTEASIRRLECISEHEVVRNQITVAHISFAMYHPDLANDFRLFVQSLQEQLLSEYKCGEPLNYYHDEYFRWNGFRPSDEVEYVGSEETHLALKNKAKAICRSWGLSNLKIGRNGRRTQKYLLNAHEEYKRRFNEQQQLMKNNSFTTRIASAFAKMPLIYDLMVNDMPTMNHLLEKDDIWQALQQGEPSIIAQRYVRPMTFHMNIAEHHRLPICFPIEAALHLLASLDGVDVVLSRLQCRLPFEGIKASQIDYSPYIEGLEDMGMSLYEADVSIPYWCEDCLPDEQKSKIEKWGEGFLLAMMRYTSLQRLRLNTPRMSSYDGIRSPCGRLATAPVMEAIMRERTLRELELEQAVISADTLKCLMAPYKEIGVEMAPDEETGGDVNRAKLHLEVSVIELAAPDLWADALDLLRGGVDDTSKIHHGKNGVLGRTGGLNHLQRMTVFETQRDDGETPATKYIRGKHDKNPVAWMIARNDYYWGIWPFHFSHMWEY